MAKKIKYETKEEKYEAQKRWAREYYYRNKEECKKKRMERYYGKKQQKINN